MFMQDKAKREREKEVISLLTNADRQTSHLLFLQKLSHIRILQKRWMIHNPLKIPEHTQV